jgi:hypothetical protein
MGILRNGIDIVGITPENELPTKDRGQIIEYSELDYIFIPDERPRVHRIHNVSIKIDISSSRIINASFGRIIVLDGVRKIKVIYTQRGHSDKACILNIEAPYNTFIDVPKGIASINSIDVHIADAYFGIADSRKIYNHTLYLVDVDYDDLIDSTNENKGTIAYLGVNAPSNTFLDDFDSYNDNENVIVESHQALNEVTLSSVINKEDNMTSDILLDTYAEYL